MKHVRPKHSARRHAGQSVVEFAFGSLLLVMMLAAATDLGRAFYTWIVVQNMAGEGATFLALSPDADLTWSGCIAPCAVNDTFQGRARNVAARSNMGRIISPANVNVNTDITMTTAGSRCPGVPFTVSVNYHMNDLFFPGLLGFPSLTINATTQSTFYGQSVYASCS